MIIVLTLNYAASDNHSVYPAISIFPASGSFRPPPPNAYGKRTVDEAQSSSRRKDSKYRPSLLTAIWSGSFYKCCQSSLWFSSSYIPLPFISMLLLVCFIRLYMSFDILKSSQFILLERVPISNWVHFLRSPGFPYTGHKLSVSISTHYQLLYLLHKTATTIGIYLSSLII